MIVDITRYNVVPTYDARAYDIYQQVEAAKAKQDEIRRTGLAEPEFYYLQSKGVSPSEYESAKAAGYSKQAIFLLAEKGKENVVMSKQAINILNRIAAGEKLEFAPSYYENGIAKEYTNEKELREISAVVPVPLGKGTITFEGGAVRASSGVQQLYTAPKAGTKVEVSPGQFITAAEYSRMESQQLIQELLSGKAEEYKKTTLPETEATKGKTTFETRYSGFSPEFMGYIANLKEKGQFDVALKGGEFVFTETPASIAAKQQGAITSISAEPGKELVATLGSGKNVPYSGLTPAQQAAVQAQYGALEAQANIEASKFYGVSGRYYGFKAGTLTETDLGANIQAQPQKYGLAPTAVFTEKGGMTLTPKAYLELKYPAVAQALLSTKKELPLQPGESRFGSAESVKASDIYAEGTGESGIFKEFAKAEGQEFQLSQKAGARGDIIQQALYAGGGLTMGAARTFLGIRPLVQKAISQPEPEYVVGVKVQPSGEAQQKEVFTETVKLASLAVAGGAGGPAAIPIFLSLPSYEKGEITPETIAAGTLNVGILGLFEAGKSVPFGKVEMEIGAAPIKGKLSETSGIIKGPGTEIPVSFEFLVDKGTAPTKYIGFEALGRDIVGYVEEGGAKRFTIGTPEFRETKPTTYPFEGAGKLNVADVMSAGEARVQEAAYKGFFQNIGRVDLFERYLLTKEATKYAYGQELPFEKGLEIIKEGEIFKSLPKAAQENLINYFRYSQPEIQTTFYGSSVASARGALERPYGDIDVFTQASAQMQAAGAAEAIMKGGGKAKVVENTVNIDVGKGWEKAIDFHDLQTETPADTALVGSAPENVGFGLPKKPDVRIKGEPSNIYAEASGTQAARLGSSISFLRTAENEIFLGPSKAKIKRSLDFLNLIEKTGQVKGSERFAKFEEEFTPYLTKYEKEYIAELRATGKEKTTLSFKPEKPSKAEISPSAYSIAKESVSARSISQSSPSISKSMKVSQKPSASPSQSPSKSISKSISPGSPSISKGRPSPSPRPSLSPKPSPSISIKSSISIKPSFSPSIKYSMKPSPSISPPSTPPSRPPSAPPSTPPSRPPSYPPSKQISQISERRKYDMTPRARKAIKVGQGPIFASLAAVSRSQARYGAATQPSIATSNKIWKGAARGEKELQTVEQMKAQRYKKVGGKSRIRLI